jgi:hypothetical protein
MSASSQTRYYHGSSPSPNPDCTGTTVRHKRADNDIQDSNNPIPVPSSGIAFGWRKSSKENFASSPAGSISNLRWFVASAFLTGLYFGAWLNAVYTQGSDAGDDAGVTGFTDTTPNQTTNNASNYLAASPLTVNAGTVLSNPSTGEGSQSFVVTQMGVYSTYAAGPGPITPVGVTYRYSET